MPVAGGYWNTISGRSIRSAMAWKWRSTMSGLSWAPHMNSVGGNTSSPAAPSACASRASSMALRVPSAYTPEMIGTLPATSSSAIARERRRSSRRSDETSDACPLATMPVTPSVSASQRRWRRYAGSSISRSAVNGSRFAGRQPWKRRWVLFAGSCPLGPSPGLDGKRVRDVADRLDVPAVVEDHRHDIEPAGRVPDPLQLEISLRQPAEAALLARVDGGLWGVALHVPPGLHLDEHERRAVPRHEVDLAGARPHVPVDDRVAAPREKARCRLLAVDPRRPAGAHRHAVQRLTRAGALRARHAVDTPGCSTTRREATSARGNSSHWPSTP